MADTFPLKGKWVCLDTMNHDNKSPRKTSLKGLLLVQKIVSAVIIGNQIHRIPTLIIDLSAVRGVKWYVRVCLYPWFFSIRRYL